VINEGKRERRKRSFSHTTKKYRGEEVKDTRSKFRHSMDMNGQIQLSAELPWCKDPRLSTEYEDVGELQRRCGGLGQAEVSLPERESKPGCLSEKQL